MGNANRTRAQGSELQQAKELGSTVDVEKESSISELYSSKELSVWPVGLKADKENLPTTETREKLSSEDDDQSVGVEPTVFFNKKDDEETESSNERDVVMSSSTELLLTVQNFPDYWSKNVKLDGEKIVYDGFDNSLDKVEEDGLSTEKRIVNRQESETDKDEISRPKELSKPSVMDENTADEDVGGKNNFKLDNDFYEGISSGLYLSDSAVTVGKENEQHHEEMIHDKISEAFEDTSAKMLNITVPEKEPNYQTAQESNDDIHKKQAANNSQTLNLLDVTTSSTDESACPTKNWTYVEGNNVDQKTEINDEKIEVIHVSDTSATSISNLDIPNDKTLTSELESATDNSSRDYFAEQIAVSFAPDQSRSLEKVDATTSAHSLAETMDDSINSSGIQAQVSSENMAETVSPPRKKTKDVDAENSHISSLQSSTILPNEEKTETMEVAEKCEDEELLISGNYEEKARQKTSYSFFSSCVCCPEAIQ